MTSQYSLSVVQQSALASRISLGFHVIAVFLLILVLGVCMPLSAQSPEQKQSPPAKPALKKKHRWRITENDIMAVSLKADKARMSEVTADLSRRLRTPVILGASLKQASISVEFADLLFEPAMTLLAPRVLVDYEIRADAKPKMLAIYLMGTDDPEPAKNETVKSASEAIMIEGNTEDETAASSIVEDDPLRVDLDDNFLTIRSKKQPLIAVVLTVAEVLEVPAEIQYESAEIIDTVIKDTPFEDALTRLSPNVRVYVRADLTRSTRAPLRVRLVTPQKIEADVKSGSLGSQ